LTADSKKPYKRPEPELTWPEVCILNGGEEAVNNEVNYLKHVQPDGQDERMRVCEAVEKTHEIRRFWIKKEKPSAAEIINKFPVFQKMPSLVCIILKI
jgi:hypothetical protein